MTLRTVDWVDDAVVIVDQTKLPADLSMLRLTTVQGLIDAIERLAVRGAPALGVAGAFGVALAWQEHDDPVERVAAIRRLREARPTAVNLARMVDRVSAHGAGGLEAVVDAAREVRDEEIAASTSMGELGADLVAELLPHRSTTVMTICNTGGLASVERGTALAVAHTLHDRGRLREVLALETRPLLQGARLTAWELSRIGAAHRVLVDAAAASVLRRGLADVVLVGADRIAANADTANKIGTYALALGAQAAGVPFVVVAPESTIDPATPDGGSIEIEDRDPAEVTDFGELCVAPAGTSALNPAFDVTPASLITAVVTDRRVVRLDRGEGL